MALILFVAGCSLFLAYRLSQSPGSGPDGQESLQTTDAHCNQTLWQYVYNPGRLQVLNPCISVTGAVEEIRKEADGDIHIRFRLDRQFASLLNEKNISNQQGDLILEPICQGKVRQADAEELCSQYNGPYFEPVVGQRYLVSGAYVHDADHGWNELHPVTSMQPIETTFEYRLKGLAHTRIEGKPKLLPEPDRQYVHIQEAGTVTASGRRLSPAIFPFPFSSFNSLNSILPLQSFSGHFRAT